MLSNLGLLTYKVLVKMSDFLNPEIRRNMSRKGGRCRVQKGFAKMDKTRLKKITSEAGKKGMRNRWHGKSAKTAPPNPEMD